MRLRSAVLAVVLLSAAGFTAASSAAAASDGALGPGCSQPDDCNDDNPCTEDQCSPEGQCSNFPNYDVATTCCNPTSGALSVLDCDETYCYDSVCFPMGCTCCDLPDGDPCAAPAVPTAGAWGVVAMGLLVLTAGTLAFGRRRRAA